MTAAQGRRNRNAGNQAERNVARWLRDVHGWTDARTTRNADRGAGRQSTRGDIAGIPATVEIKCVIAPAFGRWLDQLQAEANHRRLTLLWKHAGVAVARPEEWLAVVADHPGGMLRREVARPYPITGRLDSTLLRSVVGWLDVMDMRDLEQTDPPPPVLSWDAGARGRWLLMRADTWAAEVLPRWEPLADLGEAA